MSGWAHHVTLPYSLDALHTCYPVTTELLHHRHASILFIPCRTRAFWRTNPAFQPFPHALSQGAAGHASLRVYQLQRVRRQRTASTRPFPCHLREHVSIATAHKRPASGRASEPHPCAQPYASAAKVSCCPQQGLMRLACCCGPRVTSTSSHATSWGLAAAMAATASASTSWATWGARGEGCAWVRHTV